ncbi:MAG TPA: hypothetical protein VFZ27_07560 [Terriglobia bacterium]|nr:hypothetical protein [Terriglobia bacterium]
MTPRCSLMAAPGNISFSPEGKRQRGRWRYIGGSSQVRTPIVEGADLLALVTIPLERASPGCSPATV